MSQQQLCVSIVVYSNLISSRKTRRQPIAAVYGRSGKLKELCRLVDHTGFADVLRSAGNNEATAKNVVYLCKLQKTPLLNEIKEDVSQL